MCFQLEEPPFSNPPRCALDLKKSGVYADYLSGLGFRFPKTPRLTYRHNLAPSMCHPWLEEAAERWVPELYPNVKNVYFEFQYDIVDLHDIITPRPAQQGDAAALPKKIRNSRRWLAPGPHDGTSRNKLIENVVHLLDYFPPSEAFTWLVSHNLVPVIHDRAWSYRSDPPAWFVAWDRGVVPTAVTLVSLYDPERSIPTPLHAALAQFGQ